MQTLFKSNLFSSSSSKMGAKSFLSGGKKLGSSIVGAAKNNIVNFARTAQAMIPQKKEEKENNFIKNYTNFFGSKKTEKILRKNLKLVRDSLVNTFEIAKLLKASIVSITKNLKGGFGKGGGIFGLLSGGLGGILIAALPILLKIAAIGSIVGIGIALLNSPKFREAFFKFVESSASVIWKLIKTVAMASIKFMFGETKHSKEVKESLKGSVINAQIEEHGAEKTLQMLREQYDRDKESGFLDTFRAKRDGIEDEYIRRMTDVERKLAKEQGTKNIVSIMEKEINIRTEEIRKERNNSPELKEIMKNQDKKAYDEYRAETKRLMKDMEKEIREKYKQILVKGADGGSIDESVSGIGKKFEGSTAFDKPIKEVSEKKVEGVKESGEVKSDANQNVSSPFTTENNVDTTPFNVDAVKSNLSDSSFTTSYKMTESGSIFNLQPIPTTIGDATNRSSSGGDVTSTSNGGTSGGDAVTFYSSSNPDSSYHKLNALMTFNIV